MTAPFCNIGDVLAVLSAVIGATIAPMLFGASLNSDLLLLLLPLLGSLLMTGAAILLNPEPETRRIVMGRSIIAVLFGIAGPNFFAMIYNKFNPETVKPIILVIVGSMFAFATYILSRPFFNEAYRRSGVLAKLAADEMARRAKLPTEKPSVTIPAVKPPKITISEKP